MSNSTGHPGSPFMMQPFTLPGGLDSLALAQVESTATTGNAKTVDGAVSMVSLL